MTTTAILCIARNEVPFTEEWLEHHFSIGIDRIYYISTDSDYSRVEAFFEGSRFRTRVELLHFDSFEPGWQMRCYNAHLPLVEEDWVLVIDIDEFLYLNSASSIGSFLETIDGNVGQVQFPWLLSMSQEYFHSRTSEIASQAVNHLSDHVKSMVRRRDVGSLGIHNHQIGGLKSILSSGQEMPNRPRHSFLFDDARYCERHPFILHFCARGHFDVLNRIIDHQFFNEKNGQHESERLARYLLGNADWSHMPNRYSLMKFYASLPVSMTWSSILNAAIGSRRSWHPKTSVRYPIWMTI